LGGLQPLIVLPLAWFFIGEAVSSDFLLAFVVITIGTVMISYGKGKASRVAYTAAFFSAVLFAVSLVIAKYTYNSQNNFITPFVMTRIGSLLFAVLLFTVPKNFKDFMFRIRHPKKQASLLLMFGQISGALASVLVNLAIAISSGATAIINSLQGLQYAFLLGIIIVMQRVSPGSMKEKLTPRILWQKIIATALIIVGLAILAF
jgi:drug/metabolite transporter (DMT)-like permease